MCNAHWSLLQNATRLPLTLRRFARTILRFASEGPVCHDDRQGPLSGPSTSASAVLSWPRPVSFPTVEPSLRAMAASAFAEMRVPVTRITRRHRSGRAHGCCLSWRLQVRSHGPVNQCRVIRRRQRGRQELEQAAHDLFGLPTRRLQRGTEDRTGLDGVRARPLAERARVFWSGVRDPQRNDTALDEPQFVIVSRARGMRSRLARGLKDVVGVLRHCSSTPRTPPPVKRPALCTSMLWRGRGQRIFD